MAHAKILVGDVLTRLGELPNDSVHCVVTSPPYWGLRDYGVEGQIGLEPTPAEFIAKMVAVFAEVRRVLRPEGTCWINMGDSYAGSWGNYGGQNRGSGGQRDIANGSQVPNPAWDGREQERPAASGKLPGLKPKDLIGMPWRLAFALQEDGWWLRQDIIWSKPNPMPESVTDRCTKAHEYVFLLTKSARYHYDADAIKEDCIADHLAGNKSHKGATAYLEGDERHRTKQGLVAFAQRTRELGEKGAAADSDEVRSGKGAAFGRGAGWRNDPTTMPEKRNKRSVWEVATEPFAEAHFATFPTKLIEPCIRAGCPEGGTVLDPFNGSGTTGLVALAERCNYIGIELNPEYVAMSERRIAAATAQGILL